MVMEAFLCHSSGGGSRISNTPDRSVSTYSYTKTMLTLCVAAFLVLLTIGSVEPTSAGNHIATHPQEHATCNKALCASIVSYCLIQDMCSCDPAKNCSCCAECAICLGEHYRHCCDCVGMRKGSNYTAAHPTVTSTVALLDEPEPELFRRLTDQPMPTLRYTILRFPIMEELAAHRHRRLRFRNREHHESADIFPRPDPPSHENFEDVDVVLRHTYDLDITDSRSMCTVAYFDQCMSLNECTWSCERMGSTSYRWFHNGCCECSGSTCLNYGNMYPKCTACMQ